MGHHTLGTFAVRPGPGHAFVLLAYEHSQFVDSLAKVLLDDGLLPLLLLARQWLGWAYVRQRLVAETVEYEESGWYDGQVWEKPIAWRQQDLLVARFQVDPVMRRLRQGAAVAAGLLLAGAGLCQAF